MKYMGERRSPTKGRKPISLKDFHKVRNKVLIWNEKGGLGDVLMQRMMFDDFQKIMPDGEFVFACLPEYMEAATDHPCISSVIDSRKVNPGEFVQHYNTCVTYADRHENRQAPFCMDHRSDIWAKYCGVTLAQHDMRFVLDPHTIAECRQRLRRAAPQEKQPVVVVAPISKMLTKSLLPHQIRAIVSGLGGQGENNIVGLHTGEIEEFKSLGIPTLSRMSLKEWMCYVSLADYVVAVDTAAFHLAGGLKKPLTGIFTFADGKVYGKYFDFVLVQKHRDNGNWDCGPCFKFGDCPKCKRGVKPCLTELTENEIVNGVQEMLRRWPWNKKPLPVIG